MIGEQDGTLKRSQEKRFVVHLKWLIDGHLTTLSSAQVLYCLMVKLLVNYQ